VAQEVSTEVTVAVVAGRRRERAAVAAWWMVGGCVDCLRWSW